MTTKSVTIRMPEQLEKQLKDEYAVTFAVHRMSFNTWLVSRIQLSFTTGV